MLWSVSGWSGPSLAFLSASVSSQSLRAAACPPRPEEVLARLFMLVSVSGWSGPSLAFWSAMVFSRSAGAWVFRPRSGVGVGHVVHAQERVGVVGAAVPGIESARCLVLLR